MPRALVATYRVQLNRTFTLAHAREIVPWLERLGVSHLYCSPVLRARAGSTHGYDVADPSMVNPEIGSEDDFRALAAGLHARGMGIVLDIVPNHMGIGQDNPYWWDVLEHGERSRWARWFDIDWSAARNTRGTGRVVLPVLAAELDTVIDRGEFRLEVPEGETRLRYHDHCFPIDADTLPRELEVIQLDPESVSDPSALITGDDGRARLRALLEAQHYRLAYWKTGVDEINYRRFFDVNDLAGLRQEDPEVFGETHALVLKWVADGVVDGLRIDHVDGLLDPRGYLERLRASVAERGAAQLPILVEKILMPGERLRAEWPVAGTTGYEFLNDLEDAFIAARGYASIEQTYRRMRRLGQERFADIAHAGKLRILGGALRPDVARLARMLQPLAAADDRRWSVTQLRDGIAQFIAALPVYRTYVDGRGDDIHPDDALVLDRTTEELTRRAPPNADVALYVADVVRGRAGCRGGPPDDGARMPFVARLQQTSGPATAKGIEDTALYVYVPLSSRNEVGGAPDRPLEDAVDRLHLANSERAGQWPSALLATNTHDTKRSADLRSRLDVLSEVPAEWNRYLLRWRRLNRKHRGVVRGRLAPDTNTEYLFYQTLVGLWPAPRPGRRVDDLPDRDWRASTRERLVEYMLKAVKEAKTRTSWTDPDAPYEAALRAFVVAVLEPAEEAPFLQDVARFVARIAAAGQWNAYARLLLHCTSPGTPDIYRGDELWNFTLVDPDNRRPLDWDRRGTLLEGLAHDAGSPGHAAGSWAEIAAADPAGDAAKLHLLWRLLHARRENDLLFRLGEYRRLAAEGERAGHVFAFLRVAGERRAIVVASRLVACLEGEGRTPARGWGTTRLVLSEDCRRGQWRSLLDGRSLALEGRQEIVMSDLFHSAPLALLLSP